jgi:beta-galactosidase
MMDVHMNLNLDQVKPGYLISLLSPRFVSIFAGQIIKKGTIARMGFPNNFACFITFLLILSNYSFPQILLKDLPGYNLVITDSAFFDLSQQRSILLLNGKWKVYSTAGKEIKKIDVNVPSIFKGSTELIFEKSFNLTESRITDKKARLHFLGVNYSVDVIVNNIVIYRHTGGDYPFTVELPRDILYSERENILALKLIYKLDSKNTIPVRQRFLFPENYGGIIRDVYLHFTPNISVSEISLSPSFDFRNKRVRVNVESKIENREFKRDIDSLFEMKNFELKTTIFSPDGLTSFQGKDQVFQLKRNEEKTVSQLIDVSDPMLWSPESPQVYKIEIELVKGDMLIDKLIKELPLYQLSYDSESLRLNNEAYVFKGTTYIPSFGQFGNLASLKQMEDDIKYIVRTGFNSVRFAKSVPHPYYLKLCEKYGLLVFLEIPLNYIPSALASDADFITQSKNYLSGFIKGYKKYGTFTGIGLGSSYMSSIEDHGTLLNELNSVVKRESGLLSYASFTGDNILKVNSIDLYGIELIHKLPGDYLEDVEQMIDNIGKGRVFVSEATYFVNSGSSGGYVNEYTYEAQAKYFEDFLISFKETGLSGFFVNTLFEYRGDFASLISGYDENNVYNIGFISEDRNTEYLSYKVIKSRLLNTERVTIPIGTRHDSSPMIFIVFGLGLAIIVGVLVNSGRKFREDASRALLRPYNFFADVRDQRIISGYHSTVLAFVISAVMALLISSFLFYLRDNIVFERLLISFGSESLLKAASYLAWNPVYALFWLTVAFIALLIILVLIIKFASLFVRTKVFLSGIYFSTVWSLVPMILLIPLALILYRLLDSNVANPYVHIFLLICAIWIFYRLMKGIYVIFDVNPGSVYLYSIIFALAAAAGVLLYFELKNSMIDYMVLTFKQYSILELL